MTDPSAALSRVRSDPQRRYTAMAVGAVVGLAVAVVHWIGLVVGGALVGLAAVSLRRALVAGVTFGLLAWLAFAGWLAVDGVLAGALATGKLLVLSVAIAVGCSVLGSLARGFV